jgi:hypothetical protein
MVIIGLLLLSLVVIAFAGRGAPKPELEQLPPASPAVANPPRPEKVSDLTVVDPESTDQNV